MQENAIPKTSDREFVHHRQCDMLKHFIDITVTLTFVRSMDQDSALDPCDQSTISESTKSRVVSSLKSTLPYFKTQFAEIEHIDTHAPLSLRSRMSTIGQILGCLLVDHHVTSQKIKSYFWIYLQFTWFATLKVPPSSATTTPSMDPQPQWTCLPG
jgi:hypothetical protein